MHELSIAQSILRAALNEAQRSGGKHIREIRAKVKGSHHHIEDTSSLKFCLEAMTKGTIAEGARMTIELTPSTLRCRKCDFTFLAQGNALVCPRCMSGKLEELGTEEICFETVYTK
jgi:hydrogenase nickel incorporation protein HypA/HybF